MFSTQLSEILLFFLWRGNTDNFLCFSVKITIRGQHKQFKQTVLALALNYTVRIHLDFITYEAIELF